MNNIIETIAFDKPTKQELWNFSVGLNKIDNATYGNDDYLKYLINSNTASNMKYSEIIGLLKNLNSNGEKDYDIISTRTTHLLDEYTFFFNYNTLKEIHYFLFNDIYTFAGNYRNENITKNEPILYDEVSLYSPSTEIEDNLKHDFEIEKNYEYGKDIDKDINNMSKFVSSIWSTHSFSNGNTRVIACFITNYLKSKDFNINYSLFESNSLYFRNALIRASYKNVDKNILPTHEYLNKFLYTLLYIKEYDLDNEELYITDTKTR